MTPRLRIALVLFCLAVLALLAVQVAWHGPMLAVDEEVSNWFAAHRHRGLTQAMLLVSDLHQTVKLLAATALVALAFGLGGELAAARTVLVVPAGMLLNVGLKHAFGRARPVHEEPLVQIATYSFPSGHAVASTVFYGMLCVLVFAYVRPRWLRAAAVAVAVSMVLLVGFSRVYLGAHFPSDVIAGVAVGTLCLLLFLRIAGRPSPAARALPAP
jgi:membrane-associated phospholipid phosphatase